MYFDQRIELPLCTHLSSIAVSHPIRTTLTLSTSTIAYFLTSGAGFSKSHSLSDDFVCLASLSLEEASIKISQWLKKRYHCKENTKSKVILRMNPQLMRSVLE